MGTRERRQRERADTRQKILDAARDMFVRKGYEATTMRAIADRIEYTPTAIYHHFQNKEALLVELCAADFRTLSAALLRIDKVADPVQRLERIGAAYVEFALTHRMQYQLLFMANRPLLTRAPAVPNPGEGAYNFLRDACAEAIASGRFRPEFKDPDEVAQMLWASSHGLVSLHIVKAEDDWIEWRDIRRTAAHLCETLLRGLLRDPT